MKFEELANSILKEDNARRSAAGLDMDGVIAAHDSHYKDKEAELDKKEAYKDNLMRRGEDEEGIDPLTDPRFQQALDILEDLQARSPEMFEKFVTRLMDLVDYKKGVSL